MRQDVSFDFRELLEENIKISKAVLVSAEKTRKHLRRSEIFYIIRLIVILIPIIVALLYIPPFVNKLTTVFGSLYGSEQFNILEMLKDKNTDELNKFKSFINEQLK